MRSLTYCWAQDQCLQNAEIAEKGAIILLLMIASIAVLVCAAIILHQAYKFFIVLADAVGAHILHLWRGQMYLKLAWIIIGLIAMYLLGHYWNKGLVPFVFFWCVVYSYMIRPKGKKREDQR